MLMDPRTFAPPLLAAWASLPLACGSIVDEAFEGRPLGRLSGTIRAEEGLSPGASVSVAILWFPVIASMEDVILDGALPADELPICDGWPAPRREMTTGTDFIRWAAQPVRFQPVFPIRFELQITALPPPEVMVDLAESGGRGRAAAGVLVVFEDLNGDGRFTQGRPGAPGDRFLGATLDERGVTLVVFLDGSYDPDAEAFAGIEGTLPQGLSLLRTTESSTGTVHPASDPIDITLRGTTSAFARFLFECERVEIVGIRGGPPPEGVPVQCSEDRRSWFVEETTGLETCRWTVRSTTACLDEGAPVPADWPCR